MLKKLTKVLSLLLILCLMVSMFPAVALADEGTEDPVVTETPEETTPVVTPVPEESPAPVVSPVPSETPAAEVSPAPSDTPADSEPAADESADFTLANDTAVDEEEEKELTPEDIYALIPALYSGASSSNTFYKIVHVDCGRKYFSPENIKKIIDNAAAAGFNQVELYLSDNQGFRFALDDMNVTTSTGNTYDLTPALGDGYSDGSKYPDGSGKYLTQSEMTDIISYAAGKGIDIVPCINVPGHMGAILEEFTQFKYSGSNSSIDLENAEAVAFALAITEKYATYFKSQGVKYYNLGADEYANDLSTMGFQGLYTSGKYQKFVDFLNAAAQIVINHGMTPRAFNDGIYYNEDNTYSINPAIQVCYWSCGWSGYNLASAQYIVNRGMDVINTHGDYYWVLGNTSWQCSADKASKFDYTSFQYRTGTTGNGTISDPAGAMFCIWCDVGNANGTDGGAAVVSATADVIAAFGAALPASESGGSSETEITIQKDGNDVTTFSVKMDGTATLSLSDGEATATWTSSNESVATVTAVTAARSTEVVANSVTVNPVGQGASTIIATLSDGTALTADVTVTAAGTTEEPVRAKEIVLEVGDTTQENQENVNNKGNVDRANLDTDIATVEVTGTDATEATTTYTQADVTCNTLISSNFKNWTAVKDFYYMADDGNYYPVYAKRSSSWGNYTYTWGYSKTDSSSDVTQIGNSQSTYFPSYTTPDITVYTKSVTDGSPASTTITFTGVNPGTTYVKVGDTTYKIIVNYNQETINATIDQATTVTVSGELDATKLDTSIARVSIENNTMTVTGVAEGETQVTVGNTIYTIKVTKEDLRTVTPLTVEFWITNQQVTANEATSMTIAASTAGVYSENGVDISTLVPSSGTQGGNTMVFWKGTRLASDNKQTTGGGVDKTKSGTDFVYIRYWNQSWAYSNDGLTWTNVASGDQIVAYYLQQTEVTDEITTLVSDYGNVPGAGSYLAPFVMVDYAVKYESGELTPSSFPTGKTIAFHCNYESEADLGNTVIQDGDTYYRKLGTIKAVETADYEVYMITLTPTSDTKTVTVASNAYNATYTYSGTEKVLWVDDEANLGDFADESLHYTSPSGSITYSVGGEPNISGLEIYKNQCMLVTYYVRAKVTEDSLAVHYVDQTANQEFYSYNIAVQAGTVFDMDIGRANPWKGDLANGSVTNLQGKTQTVSADLSTMPAIGAQYRYSEYTCEDVVRSSDGKEVTLYYTFNNAHSFVIDFGLPLKITTSDLSITGDWTSASVSGAQYGTATATVGDGVTYTPSQTLKGVETLQLTLTGSTGSVTHQIYIYPATTVYYEEGFATYTGSWGNTASKGTGTQAAQIAGQSTDEYGYDAKYAGEGAGPSNGSQATSITITDAATFSFTGTGVDIYANCTEASGAVNVVIRDSNEALVKLLIINTKTGKGTTGATAGQDTDSYSLPIASVTGLTHGTYTVTVRHSKLTADDTGKPVSLDGFRVYGTLATEPKFYMDDAEDNPTYIELRDRVLKALSVNTANSQYASDIAEYTLAQVYATGQTTEGAVVISSNTSYTSENVQDLLDNGPKNEIFLRQNESLVFNVTTNREVQIGLKAVNSAVTCTVNGTEKTINSSTDMFYSVLNKTTSGNKEVQTITITNTSSGILSITKLKICDDPGATLGELTEEDLIPALVGMGYEPEPEEPVVEYADATLTVEVNGQTATLTKNGVVGESATFTAEDIEAAAQSLVPEGYELKDQAEAVTVAYGETSTVKLSAEEIPTEPEEPEQPTEPEKPEQPSKPANIISAVIRLIDRFFGSLKGLFR